MIIQELILKYFIRKCNWYLIRIDKRLNILEKLQEKLIFKVTIKLRALLLQWNKREDSQIAVLERDLNLSHIKISFP